MEKSEVVVPTSIITYFMYVEISKSNLFNGSCRVHIIVKKLEPEITEKFNSRIILLKQRHIF